MVLFISLTCLKITSFSLLNTLGEIRSDNGQLRTTSLILQKTYASLYDLQILSIPLVPIIPDPTSRKQGNIRTGR